MMLSSYIYLERQTHELSAKFVVPVKVASAAELASAAEHASAVEFSWNVELALTVKFVLTVESPSHGLQEQESAKTKILG
jgi:hypothetical protein